MVLYSFDVNDMDAQFKEFDYTPSDVTADEQQANFIDPSVLEIDASPAALKSKPKDGWPLLINIRLSGYTSGTMRETFFHDTATLGHGPIDSRLCFRALFAGIAVIDCEVTKAGASATGGGANIPPGEDPAESGTDPYDQEAWHMSIKDVLYIVAYARANASTLGINPNKITLMGADAGGETACFAAFQQGEIGNLGSGGLYDEESQPNHLMVFSAPMDWTRLSSTGVVGEKFADADDPQFDSTASVLADALTLHLQLLSPLTYMDADLDIPIYAGYNDGPEGSNPTHPHLPPYQARSSDTLNDALSGAMLVDQYPDKTRFVLYSASPPDLINLTTGREAASLSDTTNDSYSEIANDATDWLIAVNDLDPEGAHPMGTGNATAVTSVVNAPAARIVNTPTVLNDWTQAMAANENRRYGVQLVVQNVQTDADHTLLVYPGPAAPATDAEAFKLKEMHYWSTTYSNVMGNQDILFLPVTDAIWVKHISGTQNISLLSWEI